MRGTVAKRLRKETVAMVKRRGLQSLPFKRIYRAVKQAYSESK